MVTNPPGQRGTTAALLSRFGKNLAALRARRNLTQEGLAEKVGVSTRYIQNVEAGDNFPSLPTLVRLRAVLRCDWNEVFAGCDKD